MAVAAARSAFWSALQNADEAAQSLDARERQTAYEELWRWYDNTMFERWALTSLYKGQHGLYRQIRGIYNPARRLVDFYASQVYPGACTIDGKTLPDGVPAAIPFPPDTDGPLAEACGQLWQWSNWQAEKAVYVRFGACFGNVLVEVGDAVDRGRVTLDVWNPRFVQEVDVDRAGHVKAYALEYTYRDASGEHVYRREVDQEAFRTFRDGRPFGYPEHGGLAAWDNPYGFAPAVWARHSHTGGTYGAPALAGILGKLRELNSVASRLHDAIGKQIDAPLAFFTRAAPTVLGQAEKRGATDDFASPVVDRESLQYLHVPDTAGKVESLSSTVKLAEAIGYVKDMLVEIEQDKPELVMWRELRQMSQVTGPSVARLMADVGNRLYEVQGNYDTNTTKLLQMATAIGGFRANTGAWGPPGGLSRAQQKFLPFDLDSYAAGRLDLEISPRPLVPITAREIADTKLQQAQVFKTIVDAGVPLELLSNELVVLLERDDLTPEAMKAALGEAEAERIRREQTLALSDEPDGVEM